MDRDVKQNIAENAPIENPPEGGAGRDPLQDLSPEACTFEVFQQLNSKTGTLRVQAYAGQRTFPVPGASVLVTHDFADGTRRFSAGVTDESGVFGDILLPAPNNALAQSPTGRDAVCALRYTREPPGMPHGNLPRGACFPRCDVDTAGAVFGGR